MVDYLVDSLVVMTVVCWEWMMAEMMAVTMADYLARKKADHLAGMKVAN